VLHVALAVVEGTSDANPGDIDCLPMGDVFLGGLWSEEDGWLGFGGLR
jgi:hypothetical protein